MWTQKNQNVEPRNPRIKQRKEEESRSNNPSGDLAFKANSNATPVDKGPVTSQPRPRGAPMFLILGGMFVGLLALAGTIVLGVVVVKSVRGKRS